MSWPWQSGQSGQPRPGIGGAHDDADRDQPESGREGERGELLEAVHEAAILPRRHVPTDRDTLSRDDSPTPCSPLLSAARPARGGLRARRPPSAAPSAGAVRRGLRHRPRAERPERLGSPGDGARRSSPSSSRTRSPAARRGSCSSTSTRPTASPSAPDRTVKVAFYDLGPRSEQGRRDRRRRRSSGRSRTSAACTSSTSTCPRPARGAPSSRPRRPGSPAETVRLTFDVRDSLADGRRSARRRRPRRRRPSPTSAATSRRSRPTRSRIRPSTRPRSPTRSPRTSRSCSSSRRPKFCTSQQCGPTLDQFKPIAAANPDVTFINVEPYQLEDRRRRAPAGPRREQPAPGDGRHRTSGACSPSRGSSRSTGTASSRARTS